MYILKCSGGYYYTGSTIDLERRLSQHKAGEGANFTKAHLPVELVYFEEFESIDWAFYREKQVQKWSRKKKKALIEGDFELLSKLSKPSTSSTSSTSSTLSTPSAPSASSGSAGAGDLC